MDSLFVALFASLVALGLYVAAGFYILFIIDTKDDLQIDSVPREMQEYGYWSFLTIQTLFIQIVTYVLHLGAHFFKPLVRVRDLLFTSLAFPLSCLVFTTFWTVWHVLGRELIFPLELEIKICPWWLNHIMHTIILPMNILLAISIEHKYFKQGFYILATYMCLYFALLVYVKTKIDFFVYIFLEKFDTPSRIIYFMATGILAGLMYKLGEWLTIISHKRVTCPSRVKPIASQTSKQK